MASGAPDYPTCPTTRRLPMRVMGLRSGEGEDTRRQARSDAQGVVGRAENAQECLRRRNLSVFLFRVCLEKCPYDVCADQGGTGFVAHTASLLSPRPCMAVVLDQVYFDSLAGRTTVLC